MAVVDCVSYQGLISRQVLSAASLESTRIYMIGNYDSTKLPVGTT